MRITFCHAPRFASVLNADDVTRTVPVVDRNVQELLDQKLADKNYFCNQKIPESADDKIKKVDGARVLKEIFNSLTETRVSYDKVRHAPLLTQWLIANAPAELHEAADFLFHVLDQQ